MSDAEHASSKCSDVATEIQSVKRHLFPNPFSCACRGGVSPCSVASMRPNWLVSLFLGVATQLPRLRVDTPDAIVTAQVADGDLCPARVPVPGFATRDSPLPRPEINGTFAPPP